MNGRLILFLLFFILSFTAYGLVDYSDNQSNSFARSNGSLKVEGRNKKVTRKTSVSKRISRHRQSSAGSSGNLFSLRTTYEKVNYQLKSVEGNLSLYKFDGSFKTNYDIFLDFNYWGVLSESGELSSGTTGSDSGNLTTKIGFNWIKVGNPADRSTIDLFAGFMVGAKDSILGSSRNNKIFGIETSKRFYNIAIGFGYEYTLTGSVKDSDELEIGNIQKISAGIAVVISPDISVLIEGATIKINKGSENSMYRLPYDISYAYVAPKLALAISPLVSWELGALFRTKKDQRVKDSEILSSKLWNIDGTYGNSIFSGLMISI